VESLDDFQLRASAASLRRVWAQDGPEGELAALVRRDFAEAASMADRVREAAPQAGAGYPGSKLAGHLRTVAGLIKAGYASRVYYARQGSYDTHSNQLFAHRNLLLELGGAVKAFLDDLKSAKLADRVLVLVFSEFGRTVKENSSAGTDHGTAGPVFVAGTKVKAGVVGKAPSL